LSKEIIKKKGILFIISAPSGAGKTSLTRELLDIFPDIRQSISFTTRKPRPGDIEGKDYFFIDNNQFNKMISDSEFAEWAEVHGNFYGTAIKTLEESRKAGNDIILDIDCQGARILKDKGIRGVNIFILPPSWDELRKRLVDRGTDSIEVIEKRIKNGVNEVKEAIWYDYVIINDNMDKAVETLKAIIIAEHQRYENLSEGFLKQFLD